MLKIYAKYMITYSVNPTRQTLYDPIKSADITQVLRMHQHINISDICMNISAYILII